MRAEAGDSICFSLSLPPLLVEIKDSLLAHTVRMESQVNVAEEELEWTKKERRK